MEFEQPYFELDVLYYLKLSGDHVVLKRNFFSYSIQATTTDTQLLFFQQIMFHSNTRKVLGRDASATGISCVLRYRNSVVGLASQAVSTLPSLMKCMSLMRHYRKLWC